MHARACYRYINNRPNQLDYKTAIEKGLPIGSGEIESAHRYVLQKRLKLSGAWWLLQYAKNMINLRKGLQAGFTKQYECTQLVYDE